MDSGNDVSASTGDGRGAAAEYALGYTDASINAMKMRTADREASLLLARLKPGMSVLDLGCGPGTITIDLARAVDPGDVTAIDIDEDQVSQTAAMARDAGVGNAQFIAADIYALPFDDDRFDAITSNNVFEHLDRPLDGLAEAFRVLKPGGVIGLTNPDWSVNDLFPETPTMRMLIDRVLDAENYPGINRSFGRRQQSLMRQAGFAELETIVRYGTEFKTEHLPMIMQSMDRQDRVLVNLGVISEQELADPAFRKWLSSGIREWLAEPDSMCGPRLVYQTVGFKPV